MRQRIFLVMVLGLVLLMTACGNKEAVNDGEQAAVINGQAISQEMFDRYCDQLRAQAEQTGASFGGEGGTQKLADLKQNAMDGLINETLILQSGKKEEIKATDKEVNDILEQQIRVNFETDEEYQGWLDSMKMTENEVKQRIEYQLTGQKLFDKITEKITVTDDEASKFYASDKTPWDKIKVSHILISVEKDQEGKVPPADLAKAKEKALSLIKELDQGASFSDLAKKHSEDPGSGSLGGAMDMEFARNDQGLVAEFVEGAFLLDKVGDYSKEPVLSQFGYHIIKLDAKKGSFEDVKIDVKNQLAQIEKNKAFEQYMDKLHQEGEITNNLLQK